MRILLLCLISLLAACQSHDVTPPPPAIASQGRDHADLGVIRELASGRTLTPQELVERLAAAPRVLVGEQHDNPDHHALQLWLLRQLAAQRPHGSLLPHRPTAVPVKRRPTRTRRCPGKPIGTGAFTAHW